MIVSNTMKVNRRTRYFVGFILLLFALYFLIPMYVMVVNSVKPLEEIREGNMMALPRVPSFAYWQKAWSEAQVGVEATGLRPYFINSLVMVIPSVIISTAMGALSGFVLAKWSFKGDTVLFALILFGCFIPFQIVLIPTATILGRLRMAGTTQGLVLVHVVYGISFTTLFFRNFYATLPKELIQSAQIDGATFMEIFTKIILPNSAPVIMVSIIWQTTNIWNDFLFGASFGDASSQPMTVALNNLVSSSTGVKEYNVHFAGAIMAALPTLIMYQLSGRYFVRGLTAGSVKE